jgi:hypothetical protein
MIHEMTIQLRVGDFAKGQAWYQTLLQREPDFVPHEGFAEWEVLPGCWLQVAEGEPAVKSGPLRLGVPNLDRERERMIRELGVEPFEIFAREEVPVRWGTFTDPWGNQIGFFQYKDPHVMSERINTVLGIEAQ